MLVYLNFSLLLMQPPPPIIQPRVLHQVTPSIHPSLRRKWSTVATLVCSDGAVCPLHHPKCVATPHLHHGLSQQSRSHPILLTILFKTIKTVENYSQHKAHEQICKNVHYNVIQGCRPSEVWSPIFFIEVLIEGQSVYLANFPYRSY